MPCNRTKPFFESTLCRMEVPVDVTYGVALRCIFGVGVHNVLMFSSQHSKSIKISPAVGKPIVPLLLQQSKIDLLGIEFVGTHKHLYR